jgi:hypothetical protein
MKLNSRLVLFLFFLLPALLAIAAIAEILLVPSDPTNSAFLGLSLSRLALLSFLVIATIFFAVLAGIFWKYPTQTHAWIEGQLKKKFIFVSMCGISILILITTYIILAIPEEYLHEYHAIHERARPLLAWLSIASFQVTFGLLAWYIIPNLKENLDQNIPYKQILRTGVITFCVLLGIWIFIGFTKIGVWPGNAFWGKAGVPVLWPQILLALGISIAIQFILIKKPKLSGEKSWLDIGICTLIWLAAFILWSNQSFIPGVFSTPPRPPAFQIYLASDSSVFDSAAQNLLIGGIFPAATADKPIYISFLAILHILVGSNYSNLYLLQVAIFALIPVIGYALGKTVHSRQMGIMFGVLLVFREQNAIALTNIIQVSTSKMILSEMLTTLGVLLFTLLLVKWLKKPEPLHPQLWLAGGVLGLTGLARLNALTIVPFAILSIGMALKFKLREWLLASVLFIGFVGLSIIPWSVQSYSTTNNPLAFITGKTGGVIFESRYTPVITEEKPAVAATQTPDKTPDKIPEEKAQDTKLEKYLMLGTNIAQHYIHNLISMVVMLPPSGSLYRLSDMTIRLPYWKLYWNGELQAEAYLIIFMVLSFISLGLSTAWRRSRTAGIAPLLVVLGYDISTALALTSGGRYMVPMDWCMLFYFSIGTVEITRWLWGLRGRLPTDNDPITTDNPGKRPINYAHIALIPLIFLASGSAPVLLENLPPTLYPQVSQKDFTEVVESTPELSTTESLNAISFMLKDPLIRIEHGRALYPRYYPAYHGESNLVNGPILTNRANFNRLTFYLIGTENIAVVLPISGIPNDFNTNADVWIVGCDRKDHIEALLLILQDQSSTRVYQRNPPKLTCQ